MKSKDTVIFKYDVFKDNVLDLTYFIENISNFVQYYYL